MYIPKIWKYNLLILCKFVFNEKGNEKYFFIIISMAFSFFFMSVSVN